MFNALARALRPFMADKYDKSTVAQTAGGGASEGNRSVGEVHEITLSHLKRIFESHAGPKKTWDNDQIKTFIRAVQHEANVDGSSSAHSDSLRHLAAQSELDFNGFLNYMTSSATAITKPRPKEDLSWPLASYYISSSHNTYLSGNQLYSDSTTEAYTNVLRRGCRCVEIDVWDGDDSDSESSSDEEGQQVLASQKLSRRKSKRASTFNMLKDKLPDAVASRLEKTSLGKKYDSAADADGAPKPMEKAATSEVAKSDEAPKPAATKAEQGPVSDVARPEATPKAEETPKPDATPVPEVGLVEPRVLHGYTLTKEVSFRQVCHAIRDSAFVASDLPLIVSLEVHCSAQQQGQMVEIMQHAWKGLLVSERAVDAKELPSPDQLRKKILIKVKYAPPGESVDATDEAPEERRKSGESPKAKKKGKKEKKPPPKIVPELSKLGIYTKAVSFKSFTQPEATMPTHIFSLSEQKFLDYHEKHPMDLLKHNMDFLMRAYPSGLRVSSSNLNPAIFWGSGTQIVALNWQQTDEGMMLNEGMFAGTSGYVLKPQGYRPERKSKTLRSVATSKTLDLCLTVIAAQSLPIPAEDDSDKSFKPYLKVELHVDGSKGKQGGPIKSDGHEREGEYKERTKTRKGCDIDFKQEKLEFKGIPGLVDELTFVRFTVRDDEIGRDDLAAWACVRLDRLAEGYRFIHLMDSEGRLTDGLILVKVEKKLR